MKDDEREEAGIGIGWGGRRGKVRRKEEKEDGS